MESVTAGTEFGGGSMVLSHLSARELELLVFRMDHPGEPVPPPRMDDEDATTALRTQQSMHCVQENCLACTGWIALGLPGSKPCTCTCHPDETEDGETEDGEYYREVFAQAAADVYLLD